MPIELYGTGIEANGQVLTITSLRLLSAGMTDQNLKRLLDAALGSIGSDHEASSDIDPRIRDLEVVIDEGRADSVLSVLHWLAAQDDGVVTATCEVLYAIRTCIWWEAVERAVSVAAQVERRLHEVHDAAVEDRRPESIVQRQRLAEAEEAIDAAAMTAALASPATMQERREAFDSRA